MLFDASLSFYILIFIALLIGLYFISRVTIQKLFTVFHLFLRSDVLVMYFLSLIFLPGTIIHELSHFIMAMILLLPVHEIKIFPERKGAHIKLGHVLYEKKDVLRGILVGIAPLLIGILFFWWLYQLDLFTNDVWYLQIIKIYIVFVISSTMFSSQQDLVDIIYVIPVSLLIIGIVWFFEIDLRFILQNQDILAVLTNFVYSVTVYTAISFIIHIILIGILQIILTSRKKFI